MNSVPRAEYKPDVKPVKQDQLNNKPEWLQSMSVLEIKENDILVVRSNKYIPAKQIDHISTHIKAHFDSIGLKNAKIMFIEDEMDVGVIRQG
jgi:hypothetical protein